MKRYSQLFQLGLSIQSGSKSIEITKLFSPVAYQLHDPLTTDYNSLNSRKKPQNAIDTRNLFRSTLVFSLSFARVRSCRAVLDIWCLLHVDAVPFSFSLCRILDFRERLTWTAQWSYTKQKSNIFCIRDSTHMRLMLRELWQPGKDKDGSDFIRFISNLLLFVCAVLTTCFFLVFVTYECLVTSSLRSCVRLCFFFVKLNWFRISLNLVTALSLHTKSSSSSRRYILNSYARFEAFVVVRLFRFTLILVSKHTTTHARTHKQILMRNVFNCRLICAVSFVIDPMAAIQLGRIWRSPCATKRCNHLNKMRLLWVFYWDIVDIYDAWALDLPVEKLNEWININLRDISMKRRLCNKHIKWILWIASIDGRIAWEISQF